MMFVTRAVYSATTRIDCLRQGFFHPLKSGARTRAHSQSCRKMKRGLLVNFARSAFRVRCVLASLSWFAAKPVYETIHKWRAEPRATYNLKRR